MRSLARPPQRCVPSHDAGERDRSAGHLGAGRGSALMGCRSASSATTILRGARCSPDRPHRLCPGVKVSDVGFLPKPLQRPHPPIWIGGHSPAALRRVALVGDGWMPIALRPPSLLRPPEMADKMARLRRLLRDAGRAEDEVAISVTAPVVVTKTLAAPRPFCTVLPTKSLTICGNTRLWASGTSTSICRAPISPSRAKRWISLWGRSCRSSRDPNWEGSRPATTRWLELSNLPR